MKAGIITIGDEILVGQTVDTNSNWIAGKLSEIGVNVQQITSINDAEDIIIETINLFISKFDVVLVTGGLGPTSDDITKPTLCKIFNTRLVDNADVLGQIKHYVERKGGQITARIKEQAKVPEKAKVIINKMGSAPGLLFERNKTTIISMPGVPFEMKSMMENHIIPEISTIVGSNNIERMHILTQGANEPQLADLLSPWEAKLPDQISVAYLPSPGMIKLRITANCKSRGESEKLLIQQAKVLEKYISEYIVGYNIQSVEEAISTLLIQKNKTISTAESCTGGTISKLLTSISGSSNYFVGGVVAYSNEIKQKILEVSDYNLNNYGSVSKEVVEEMAIGALSLFNSDYSIATSGIAGPTGGTPGKPVGTTWIAVASKNKVLSEKFLFGDERIRNIQRASLSALNMLRKMIE